MADKSTLSQVEPRSSSCDCNSVEITIIEPRVRCLQSSYPQHRHHHHKRTEHKRWETREDLQKKMKEVRQRISELESQGNQESSGQSSSISRQLDDALRRNNVISNVSVSSQALTRSISEGELQHRKRKKSNFPKFYPARKAIICQACNIRLTQQEELLRFVCAQHQQVLTVMQEIKADLDDIKNDRAQHHIHRRRSESVTAVQNKPSGVKESLPITEETTVQQQQDTGCVESSVPEEDTSEDLNAASQTNDTLETENSVTTSYPEEQIENKLPSIKVKQMQKDSKRKENMECVDSFRDGSSHAANAKYNDAQPSNSKDTRALLGQRTDKVKDFPQKQILVPLNKLNTAKQIDKNCNVQQKTLTGTGNCSRSYGHKDDTVPKDNHIRQIKPLKLLRACHLRQTQQQGKDDLSNPVGTKEDFKINGNKVNIPKIPHSSKINNTENVSHNSPGGLVDECNFPATSQACSKPPPNTNFVTKMDSDSKKESPYRQMCPSSTDQEMREIASKTRGRKHKLAKLLKTKKPARLGSTFRPPLLSRGSRSSLTFVIERSKSKSPRTDQEDGNTLQFPETVAPEKDTECQDNTRDSMEAPNKDVSTSQCTHPISSSLSFERKRNKHMLPETAAVQATSTGKILGRLLTKKCLSYDKISSKLNYTSSDKMSSPSILCRKEQPKDSFTRMLEVNLAETKSNWIECVQDVPSKNQTSVLDHHPDHSLVFWDGQNLTVAEETLRQTDSLLLTSLRQDKKKSLKKMPDIGDGANTEGATAVEKDPVWEHSSPESEISQNSPRNGMEQSYMNPNFNFIPTSEACISPRYGDLGSRDKQSSSAGNGSETMESEEEIQEIELSLSFDDLEYLLLHKIKKQERKNDLVQVETLRRTLEALRQCFQAHHRFLQDSSAALISPKYTMSHIKTVIVNPRPFDSGQHVRLCTVPAE